MRLRAVMKHSWILEKVTTIAVVSCLVLVAWHFGTKSFARRAVPFAAPESFVNARAGGKETFLDPLSFVRERATGGVGLLVDIDGDFPKVLGFVKGSPGETSGLRKGDHVVAVDGVPTKGWTHEEIKNVLGGIAGTSVTIEALKADGTKVSVVVKRMNWHGLKSLPTQD